MGNQTIRTSYLGTESQQRISAPLGAASAHNDRFISTPLICAHVFISVNKIAGHAFGL